MEPAHDQRSRQNEAGAYLSCQAAGIQKISRRDRKITKVWDFAFGLVFLGVRRAGVNSDAG